MRNKNAYENFRDYTTLASWHTDAYPIIIAHDDASSNRGNRRLRKYWAESFFCRRVLKLRTVTGREADVQGDGDKMGERRGGESEN